MKDYLVQVIVDVQVRAEDANEASRKASDITCEFIQETAFLEKTFHMNTPRCVGGDDEIAMDLENETGLPYESCEAFVNSLTPEQREGLDVQQMAEMLEHKI
jgi:hypothetical protein